MRTWGGHEFFSASAGLLSRTSTYIQAS